MASNAPSVSVFGPAYLDRVLMADRPLRPDPRGPAIDRSAEVVGVEPLEGAPPTLILQDGNGRIRIDRLPADWPGPTGRVRIQSPGLTLNGDWGVEAQSWHDDLGGMGAGFAAALAGTLYPILGDPADPSTIAIERLLNDRGIRFQAIHRPARSSDWTLLISSGPYGDKLPVGFRGILRDAPAFRPNPGPHSLLVVASLSNRLVESAFHACPATVRVFAPSIRNMLDPEPSISVLADQCDVLCLNLGEWKACPDRDSIADRLALLVVTDGPNGVWIRFLAEGGRPEELRFPAFPRSRPPVDTNRAGETLAATLLRALWEGGWRGGEASRSLVETAARRALAAAALQLDLPRFGFPDASAIDRALRKGRVP